MRIAFISLFFACLFFCSFRLSGNPTAYFVTNSPVCRGNPVYFTDLSTTGPPVFGYITTWIWNFGDGTPADTINFPYNPNCAHLFTWPGTYMVTLKVTDNNGNSDDYTAPVTTRPRPVSNFMYIGSCLSLPVHFTDLSQTNGAGAIVGWQWNFGDPASGILNTSSLQNPDHQFSTTGTFAVKLRITDTFGCSDSITKYLAISSSIGGSIAGNATILLGQGTDTMVLTGYSGTVIKWQKRCNGSSYSDIPSTAGLTAYTEIPADTGTWNYQAVIQSGSCPVAFSSPSTILVLIPADNKIWTGNAGEDWNNPENWNPQGIPAFSDNITVPCCVPVMPHVSQNGFTCNNITVQAGATVTIDPGITLTVNGRMILQ